MKNPGQEELKTIQEESVEVFKNLKTVFQSIESNEIS